MLTTLFVVLWAIGGITTLILDEIPKISYAITWLTLMFILIEIFFI